MSKSYVSAVLSEYDWEMGSFRINPETGMLQYKVEEDLVDTIDNDKDDRRPAQCSDLYELLKSRNFNLLDSKGIDPNSGDLSFISGYDENGVATNYEVIANSFSLSELSRISMLQSDLMNMQIGYIPTTYLDDGTGNYSEATRYGLRENYYNFRLVKDLIRKSTVVNLMTMTDPQYIDTLDLTNITIDKTNVYDRLTIRLGVQYTKGNDIVHIKEFMFPYDEDAQYDVAEDMTMEYFNKCIRLFSSSEVNECIIKYCHLIYE